MAGLEQDTIGGCNALIERHQQEEGRAVISTVLFNHATRILHDRIDIHDARFLTAQDYRVAGTTALLDAVGGAINHVSMVQGYMPPSYRPSKTIMVITTDGMENASRKYTYNQVKTMINKYEEKGWEFLFLGANIDAAAEAGKLGICGSRAASYVADNEGTEVLYDTMVQATQTFRSKGTVPDDWSAAINDDVARRG